MTAEASSPQTESAAPASTKERTGGLRPAAAAHRKRKGLKPRHVPQRTCIITRQTDDKRKLIRLVRTPEGAVEVDPTGKRNGRGAYLTADRAVWEKALGSNVLGRALKIEIGPTDLAALRAFAETLPTDPTLAPILHSSGRPSRAPATTAGDSEELSK